MNGTLRKMITRLSEPVEYDLPVGEGRMPLNALIGQPIKLTHTKRIFCIACGRKTSRSFSQGHCYPCMNRLAACDMCIVKPETCHYHAGTCREPAWGEEHCMTPHIVYLANTSGLKVGITRQSQVPTRWMDQGATQAVPIFRVRTRRISGHVEVALAQSMADKTNWRAMLKGGGETIDLKATATMAAPGIAGRLEALQSEHGEDAIEALDEQVVSITYPVAEYPAKIASFNFDKKATVEGILIGIKGQYLMLDTGVINIRKFAGYEIDLDCGA